MLLRVADELARNTNLYVSSRTLFSVSRLYGNSYLKATFGRTNDRHTPMTAILFSSLFGFLALLGLADKSFNRVGLSGNGTEKAHMATDFAAANAGFVFIFHRWGWLCLCI